MEWIIDQFLLRRYQQKCYKHSKWYSSRVCIKISGFGERLAVNNQVNSLLWSVLDSLMWTELYMALKCQAHFSSLSPFSSDAFLARAWSKHTAKWLWRRALAPGSNQPWSKNGSRAGGEMVNYPAEKRDLLCSTEDVSKRELAFNRSGTAAAILPCAVGGRWS